MYAIEGLSKDLQLRIFAYRRTTLKNCTHIVGLGDNSIKRSGSYQDLINQSMITAGKNKESRMAERWYPFLY